MSAGVNASRVLLRERGREPKGMFFAQKLSDLGPVLNKPLLLKRVTEGAEQRWKPAGRVAGLVEILRLAGQAG